MAMDPLAALGAAEGYLAAQEALGEELRKGFWMLAKARLRVGQAWAGPGFCREELGAARRVAVGSGSGGGGGGKALRLVAAAAESTAKGQAPADGGGDGDGEPAPCPLEDLAVIVAGGLAPPELREAQKHFGHALEQVPRLVAAVQAIASHKE